MADLINEPRCDSPNCAPKVQAWIEKQSAYLKSIDSNHLVTVGACHTLLPLSKCVSARSRELCRKSAPAPCECTASAALKQAEAC